MNIRKRIDYSEMFAAIDKAMSSNLPQVELYCEIGGAISVRPEKGAAVAAAEYLQKMYPGVQGFSPRNVRRMRDFYSVYGNEPEILQFALSIGWTQNVVILEADLTMGERTWYLLQVAAHEWSKNVLMENIQNAIHLEETLDDIADPCYTDKKPCDIESAGGQYHEDASRPGVRMPREEDFTALKRIRRLLRPPGHISHLRRRLLREDVRSDRVYRPPRDPCRPMCRTSKIYI